MEHGPYLLLTREEYERGYYTWVGRTQRHYPYEVVQEFSERETSDAVNLPKMFLIIDPCNVTEPVVGVEL